MRPSFRSVRRALLWCLPLLFSACTDPYAPDIIKTPPNYLVVDGFINSQGVSTFRLSRTAAIAAAAVPPAETKAKVYIEEQTGASFLLVEGSKKGTYTSDPLTLNPASKYRLHITTLAGKDYASDFVPVKTTPPIDDVTWQTDNEGVSIYVSTHDDTNASKYYRWESEETWEINPVYRPVVEYKNGKIQDIEVSYPTICWGNAHSTIVQIAKTTSLTQDVVANFRVRQLASSSERLNTRYSILVQQYALTKEEYAYWELLRKNTESIGTLFDPQPSQITGNVHNLGNATEIVLGYVGAHSLAEKRIFIRRQELPAAWDVLNGYEKCLPPDSVYTDRPPPVKYPAAILAAAFAPDSGSLPIEPIYKGVGIVGYTTKSVDCIDCRTRGTSVKPSFW